MGYFSSGTEAMGYQERYCFQCVHWHIDYGCPCWQAHTDWWQLKNSEVIFDKIIPMDDDGNNLECYYFISTSELSNEELTAELEKNGIDTTALIKRVKEIVETKLKETNHE